MATTSKPTTTKPRSRAKGSKTAATPSAEPTSATTGAPVRTDLSPSGGTEGPSAGSALPRGASPAAEPDLQEAIAQRAYEIYEASGRPEGREAEHWAQAEREVRAQRGGR